MSDSEKSPEKPGSSPSVEEILKDWDGEDLFEAVTLLSQHYPSRSLKDSLVLTEMAEHYQKHHKGDDKTS